MGLILHFSNLVNSICFQPEFLTISATSAFVNGRIKLLLAMGPIDLINFLLGGDHDNHGDRGDLDADPDELEKNMKNSNEMPQRFSHRCQKASVFSVIEKVPVFSVAVKSFWCKLVQSCTSTSLVAPGRGKSLMKNWRYWKREN